MPVTGPPDAVAPVLPAVPLQASSDFADGLAETDLCTRYRCVLGAVASGAPVCQEGVENCDGI